MCDSANTWHATKALYCTAYCANTSLTFNNSIDETACCVNRNSSYQEKCKIIQGLNVQTSTSTLVTTTLFCTTFNESDTGLTSCTVMPCD